MEDYANVGVFSHIYGINIPKVLKYQFNYAEGVLLKENHYLCTLKRMTNMRATEIIWKEEAVLPHSANIIPSGKPYKAQMMMGKIFPTSKAQAIAYVQMGCALEALNKEDVRVVEGLLVKHHLQGNYRYVGSKMHVKLVNQIDLDKALKEEYGF